MLRLYRRRTEPWLELYRLFECIRAEMKKGSPEGYNAETGLVEPAQKPHTGEPHERKPLYRIRCTQETINYCVKMADGQIVEEGRLRATHDALRQWAGRRREPWRGAMEATLFSGWI
jgi:hypothetical protein